MTHSIFDSPIGSIQISTEDHNLLSVHFLSEKEQLDIHEKQYVLNSFHQELHEILSRYFDGLPLPNNHFIKLAGSPFEINVWKALREIPFGETRSYAEIAMMLGDKNKVRAVGRAIGKNPIAILVPCHRVIGSNGHLTGYAGGLWRKEWLLKNEGALLL